MPVTYSALESHRFGYNIGRGDLGGAEELASVRSGVGAFDIVIIRAPLDDPLLAAKLAVIDGYRAFTADHLIYWEWRGPEVSLDPIPAGCHVDDSDDPIQLLPLLRASFQGYRNHYVANPLLDPVGATEGYVEWAEHLMASGQATTKVIVNGTGQAIGFGIVDWSGPNPDIRLAGIHPEAQGAGWYRFILQALMTEAAHRQALPLHISTQSSNLNVMRIWARHGFVPFQTLATYHLVADHLLADHLLADDVLPGGQTT